MYEYTYIMCVYLPENDSLEVSPSSQHHQEIDTFEIDGSKEPPHVQVHSGTVQVIILAIPLYTPVWSQFIMSESY